MDAAFTIMHNDMRGHMGAHVMLGQGKVAAMLSKQKIKIGSSTEAKSVGVDQPLPMMLLSKLFCNTQGTGMHGP